MIKVTVKAEGKAPTERLFADQKGADWFARLIVRTARKHGIVIETLTIGEWSVI